MQRDRGANRSRRTHAPISSYLRGDLMQRITWYRLLAAGLVTAPIVSRWHTAPAQQARMPEATVRELATIDGAVKGFLRLPSSRAVIYTLDADDGKTFVYNVATKRTTLLGEDMYPAGVSPKGDRLAFVRTSEDRGQGLR